MVFRLERGEGKAGDEERVKRRFSGANGLMGGDCRDDGNGVNRVPESGRGHAGRPKGCSEHARVFRQGEDRIADR